jgi:VIT1/CCC1 family predicted Fe2+/Mn2+ transporter
LAQSCSSWRERRNRLYASLVVGVAAAGAVREDILLAGIAGMVAGALSMAAGEYVSVSSQADTERSDLALERSELAADQPAEERELAAIYVQRGLEPGLARTVAEQLMAHDALGAHARDELGLSDKLAARPLQAALASAATFAVGALCRSSQSCCHHRRGLFLSFQVHL